MRQWSRTVQRNSGMNSTFHSTGAPDWRQCADREESTALASTVVNDDCPARGLAWTRRHSWWLPESSNCGVSFCSLWFAKGGRNVSLH
eukprot:12799127-Alexandrium_andersonii.AAC.1